MRTTFRIAALCLAGAFALGGVAGSGPLAPEPAAAHAKYYLFTYDYMTAAQGELEVEYYLTSKRKAGVASIKDQLEVEYGVTNNFQVSLYGVWEKVGAKSRTYTDTKLELLNRFGKRGEHAVDTALYLEYVDKADRSKADKIEAKLIFSHDFGKKKKLNVTANLIGERNIGGGVARGLTLAVSKPLSDKVRGGLELMRTTDRENYLVPQFTARIGKSAHLNLGAGIGLNRAGKATELFRTIVTYEF